MRIVRLVKTLKHILYGAFVVLITKAALKKLHNFRSYFEHQTDKKNSYLEVLAYGQQSTKTAPQVVS